MSTDFFSLLAGDDDAPALGFVDAAAPPISRRRLREAAVDAASWLHARGLRRGDALALWLPNGAAWLQLLFAAARLGVLIVPISTRYKAPEARHLLRVSRASAIVVPRRFLDQDYAAIARELQAELPELRQVFELEQPLALVDWSGAAPISEAAAVDELLCCFSTSGTTGFPKLAAHRQAGLMRHAAIVADRLDIGAGDALLLALPMFGVFGFVAMLASLAGRARCVLLPLFEPNQAAAAIVDESITHMIGSDAMFDAMLRLPRTDWGRWRRAVLADFTGLPLSVTQRGDQLGIGFSGTYGSSECLALMALHAWHAPAEQRAKSGGVPLDRATEVRIAPLEDAAATAAEHQPGEIQIRGPNVMAGYLNDPRATERALTADRWFRSGDLGQRDDKGFVYLARLGDSLRLRGFLVSPAEIEDCLMQHPAVGGAQVVGVHQTGSGDRAVAFVTARPTASLREDELAQFCRARLASYKVPQRIVVIDQFPSINGPNGIKIQKRLLREQAALLLGESNAGP